MEKSIFSITVFVIICVAALTALYLSFDTDAEQKIAENPYIAEDYYTVQEYQGKIAVFKNNDKVPTDIFDAYVALLPAHDRELLEEGIVIQTPEELQKIIEDYTS